METLKESPKKGKSWLWIVAVVVVVIIVLIAYKGCGSEDEQSDESAATTTTVDESTVAADTTAVADTVAAEPVETSEPTPEPEPAPVVEQPSQHATQTSQSDIDDMAWRVIRGEFGNVPVRRDKLGADYQRIQDRVNELYRQGLVH